MTYKISKDQIPVAYRGRTFGLGQQDQVEKLLNTLPDVFVEFLEEIRSNSQILGLKDESTLNASQIYTAYGHDVSFCEKRTKEFEDFIFKSLQCSIKLDHEESEFVEAKKRRTRHGKWLRRVCPR